MPVGRGKYDDLATWVREQAHASGVIVIVIDGDKGQGFSVQATIEEVTLVALPDILRTVADYIERSLTGTRLR